MALDLVTLDLDGTLLPGTTAFEVVLTAAGRGEEVRASDARYFAGEATLEDVFHEQWDWFRGLTCQEVHRHLRASGAWLPGIAEGVARLRESGLMVAMLTDQPSTVTDFLARWGIEHAVCSPVVVEDGRQVEIDARLEKWPNLRSRLEALGVPPDHVVHVGNGTNDVPVWEHTAGIGVFAPHEVAAHADVDLGDVASLRPVVDEVLRMHAG